MIYNQKQQFKVEVRRVVSQFGISVWYWLVFSWYFPNQYRRKIRLVRFGIVHLAGTPFSLASAPFLMDQAPEGSSRKISQNGVPAKSYNTKNNVHTIPNIPTSKCR
jgi:hypothetical protein